MKNNKSFEVIGLMSGTSLDGMDIICVTFQHDKSWTFHIEKATTVQYDEELYKKLDNARTLNGHDLSLLNIEYGKWIGEQVMSFINEHNLNPVLIGSHGHTVFHQPEKSMTLQIGDGSMIHAITGIPVAYNFRQLDVSLGGQGAPLVPVGEANLFSEYAYCLNIGGITNLTFNNNDNLKAFDVAPANMVLNELASRKGHDFDNKGALAASGNLLEPLLMKLEKLEYYQKQGPRSLGYEEVSKDFFPLMSDQYITEDLLHTFSHHIAKMVASALVNKQEQGGKMLVTGGGAYNDFLVSLLKKYCSEVEVVIPSEEVVEFKEAIIFGFLGLLRALNQENISSNVTGASKGSCSGDLIGVFE